MVVDSGWRLTAHTVVTFLLTEQLLPVMREISGELLIFQQDSAPAHRELVTQSAFWNWRHSLSFTRPVASNNLDSTRLTAEFGEKMQQRLYPTKVLTLMIWSSLWYIWCVYVYIMGQKLMTSVCDFLENMFSGHGTFVLSTVDLIPTNNADVRSKFAIFYSGKSAVTASSHLTAVLKYNKVFSVHVFDRLIPINTPVILILLCRNI